MSSFWKQNYMLNKDILGIYLGFLGEILDFMLDILTRSWILSWISSKILPELARSWHISWKIFVRFWKILPRSCQDLGKIFNTSNAGKVTTFFLNKSSFTYHVMIGSDVSTFFKGSAVQKNAIIAFNTFLEKSCKGCILSEDLVKFFQGIQEKCIILPNQLSMCVNPH